MISFNMLFILTGNRKTGNRKLETVNGYRRCWKEAPSGREAIFPLRFSYFKNNLVFDVFP